MNSNVVNKEVQPRFPEVDECEAKRKFLERLKVTDQFSEIFCNGDEDLVRKRRRILENGQHLLDESADRKLCKKLIKLFSIELHARAATRPHERFLAKRLR